MLDPDVASGCVLGVVERGPRIGESASLAGVSVRTVRHYHAIGLLTEPSRSANGYRRYGLAELVRLLRARRLVEVGLGMDEVAGVLSREGDDLVDPVCSGGRARAARRGSSGRTGLAVDGPVAVPAYGDATVRLTLRRPGPGAVVDPRSAGVETLWITVDDARGFVHAVRARVDHACAGGWW